MKIVELKGVKKFYNSYSALREVNLEIERGDFVGIIGPSGSGKTTLLNLIGCLDKPTEGKIFIEGEDTTLIKEKDLWRIRRKKIGFIFQTFNLIETLTVYENIEFPLLFSDVYQKERKEKVERMLEELGLEKISNHKSTDISGGEKQRVAIGRALIKEPVIVLADEPTGSLDSETGGKIMELLKKLNEETKITIFVVTHNPMVMKYAKYLYKLKDGEIENENVNRL